MVVLDGQEHLRNEKLDFGPAYENIDNDFGDKMYEGSVKVGEISEKIEEAQKQFGTKFGEKYKNMMENTKDDRAAIKEKMNEKKAVLKEKMGVKGDEAKEKMKDVKNKLANKINSFF